MHFPQIAIKFSHNLLIEHLSGVGGSPLHRKQALGPIAAGKHTKEQLLIN